MLRENIDLGWAMLGLENQEPPTETLRPYVEKVVDALTELHTKEQDIAFKILGYNNEGAPESSSMSSPVNLDHLDIPQMSQIVGSQFQHHLDWTQIAVSPDAMSGERERRLLCEHIKVPAPVVVEDGGSQWHRKTPCHLQLRLGQGLSTYSATPMRLLDYDHGGETSFQDMATALIDGDIQGAPLGTTEVQVEEEGDPNMDATSDAAVVHGPATAEYHTPSR